MTIVKIYYTGQIGPVVFGKLKGELPKIISETISELDSALPVNPENVSLIPMELNGRSLTHDIILEIPIHHSKDRSCGAEKAADRIRKAVQSICTGCNSRKHSTLILIIIGEIHISRKD